MKSQKIVQNWMDKSCSTIKNYDHKAHMNLISKSVQVYGIPGFEVIGYDDWFAQCEYEFNEKLIASSSYDGLKITYEDDTKIIFLTLETVVAKDGTVEAHGVEVVLFKEPDGQWRVIEERLLNNEEARNEGLLK